MALQYIISHEAFNCATQLDGLVLVTINGVTKTRYEHWVGKNPTFAKYLRTWGEAGTVKVKTKTSPKLKDKGVHCMFVGYATEHSGDTYRMYDPKTNCIRVSRDVIWLKRMYFEQPPRAREMTIEPIMFDIVREGEQQPLPDEIDEDGDVTEESEEIEAQSQEDGEGESVSDDNDINEPLDQHDNNTTNTPAAGSHTTTTTSRQTVNRPAWMDEYEMGLTAAELKYYEAMKLMSSTDIELGLVGAGLGDGITNTKELHVMGYDEAMNQDDRVEWEKSIEDEHERMKTKPVVADEVMIPSELLMKHRQIELCMDTMFVNKQPFLTSIDKSVRFRSLVPLKSQSGEEYLRALQFIMRHYNKGGFFIQLIHCDGEYKQLIEPVQDKLNATMNFANPGDHVPEAERNNRTIKERIRAAFHRLPYKAMPRVMI